MEVHCLKCGLLIPADAAYCPKCGYVVSQGNSFPNPFPTEEPAHTGLIVTMWVLTLGYFGFDAAKNNGLASLCGLPSFIIGIYLATRPNSADKTNGWVRIGIGIVIGIVIFVLLSQRQA